LSVKVIATPARHGSPGIEPVSDEVTGFLRRLASVDGNHLSPIDISGDTARYDAADTIAAVT
jgi:hypothetical protein